MVLVCRKVLWTLCVGLMGVMLTSIAIVRLVIGLVWTWLWTCLVRVRVLLLVSGILYMNLLLF